MMSASVSFDQIEPVFDALGWTWYEEDGERRWCRHAWSLFETDGLTASDSANARNETVIRAVALWAVTRTFFAKAFDEGGEDDWRYGVYEAVGDEPKIDPSWLVGKAKAEYDENRDLPDRDESAHGEDNVDDLDYDIDLSDEVVKDMLQEMIVDEARNIGTHLRAALGEADLFASLWAARSPKSVFPLDESVIEEIFDNSKLSMVDAYGWVSDGMSVY
ncbi:hypothetical protein [Nocardia terpenica]|uniref:Uncharacterized protein n=1 Tax=Nocardia terpenica TaxID=455432 RepID=A0A6G9YZU3_9NOCA|nr:hypothetical protein [Nocardia terpenica]QIS18486.1 hypothetical protein F6W96_09510 [Nocardia terpenica]